MSSVVAFGCRSDSIPHMRAFALIGLVAVFGLGACAPLMNQTHYERWDAYAAANPPEDEEGPEAAPEGMSKAKPAAPAKKTAPPPPRAAPPADYSSLGGTPAIGTKTATASRVVTPEPADEPIY